MTITDGGGLRTLKCACGAPATVAVVVLRVDQRRRFGFCAVHANELAGRPDIVSALTGQAEIVTSFTERRLRQLNASPP